MNTLFLDACGATGPLLIHTEAPGSPQGETRSFDLPFVLAGRDPRSDLQLDHPEVSDRHAYLQLVDGQLLCFDLGSRTGIYQGGRCQRLGYMERDRSIRIGPYRVRLIAGDREAAGESDAPCPPLPLELSHRSVRQSRCDLPRGLALVGSATDCQIRLIDPSLSNYHCGLLRTPLGVWVVDLLGHGGVRVNGQDVAYAQLHPGDALQVGNSVIRLMDGVATTATTTTTRETVRPAVPPFVEPLGTQPAPTATVQSLAKQVAAVFERESSHDVARTVELVERVLSPMVSRVERVQQQMIEEFEQARALLFDTFDTLHKEQTAFINQELEQIRVISQELHTLRDEIERGPRTPADRELPAAPEPRLGVATNTTTRAIALAAPQRTPVNGTANPPSPSAPFRRPEVDRKLIRSHNEQAHAKLCVRISQLNKKRQTRWERLLSILSGTGAAEPMA